MFTLTLCSLLLFAHVQATCDGNPHGWGRQRRCDQFDPKCPDAPWALDCSVCEGIGGIAGSDDATDIQLTPCTPVATAAEMVKLGIKPIRPIWPKTFVNTGFYEQQIFVKHDPFCMVQIPAMVSNGTHCFKKQEGAFNFDSLSSGGAAIRIDYIKSRTTGIFNMTEYFYHLPDGTVHPDITRLGPLPTPVCPCIDIGAGPVAYNWAFDAQYIGRELLRVEYLWKGFQVDHFIKGPHHVWTDIETGQIVRMYQPFNGLEIFDPTKYNTTELPESIFELPPQCKLEMKLGCINGTSTADADSIYQRLKKSF